ncbi:hypothetical protein LTR91_018004 [Friedmanniomyces endolithicus]|uniref:Uncharacterized protein n=1 Tax=Friedmanniomyces endolithicus TaxID=329885 RepID=A0AAN6HG54_9PEZI|nr:hypothetical protein LTR57_013957 [Friedmanniomyces endolithicus]KAK0965432.1 hypothetical protein LTR91_018004 [Friedmanniomyces endolithicus]KAK1044694.1 hypothetical protein LTS16_007013 [Friedmanniomyces endolithicus]
MGPDIITEPSHLVNPLASVAQLKTSASQVDGVPRELEDSDIAAASLYLAAKPSGHSLTPKQLHTVFAFLESLNGNYAEVASGKSPFTPTWSLSEGDFEAQRERLYANEALLLRTLGFQTHVALPYSLCINYMQTLDAFSGLDGSALAKRAFAHLNSALLSPQRLYLTHQPCALATASIYLAAREVEVSLPDVEWWEVFDVDREELGFLIVALRSMEGFAADQQQIWGSGRVPMTAGELRVAVTNSNGAMNGE